MIYVPEDQLNQVEYLIDQSLQGNHVLFDHDAVRNAFSAMNPCHRDTPFLEEDYAAEPHMERLMLLPSLEQKRAYLEQLDPRTYLSVVRVYFNIVENSLYENLEVRH